MSDIITPVRDAALDTTIMAEIQLVLAEKRTSLAAMRTGIAIFAFPLSVLSVLVATSKLYKLNDVLGWIVLILLINAALVTLAVYLILRALRRIRHYDQIIDRYKSKYSQLAELLG